MRSMKSMLAAALLFFGAPESFAAPATHAIALAGNGYVTPADAQAGEKITDQGLRSWSSSSTVTSLWFRLAEAGRVTLSLDARLVNGRSSTVRVTLAGQSFIARLKRGARATLPLGSVSLPAGYVRVDLQGVTRDGDEFGEVYALNVTTAAPLAYANDPENFYWSRRGPSVHLAFDVPADTEYFYSELTVPKGQDTIGSYYMANGFSGGYFGIQVNSPDERRVLFSVWDAANDERTTLVGKGANVNHNPFGGEGTGGQSYLRYNWVAGNTYRFLLRARPDGNGNTDYSAWFHAPEERAWRYIATWKRPATNSWLTGTHSFLENFLDTHGYLGREAEYGNQWARSRFGHWSEIASARLTGDATARNAQRLDYAGGARHQRFYLRNGGYFNDAVQLRQIFTRPTSGTPPAIELERLPLQ